MTLTQRRVATSGVPRRILVVLTLLVLVIHLVLLQGTAAMVVTTTGRAMPFTTRAIVLNPAISPDVAVAKQATAQKPAAPVKPTQPKRPAAVDEASKAPEVPVNAEEFAINSVASNASPAAPEVTVPPAPEPAASAAASQPASETLPVASTAGAPAVPTTAYTVPGSVRLKYNVIATAGKFNYDVGADLLWRQDGNNYDAQLQIGAFPLGSRVQTTSGRLTPEGLQPKRFSDKYRSEVAAHFDRINQKVIFSANTPEVPLSPGMQDQLSVFLQLGAMLGGAPTRYPAGTQISFETVGARDTETWVFTIDGEERLSLPGGEIAVIKTSKNSQRQFGQKAELWLAPTLGYLPVRIKLTESNGDVVNLNWRATEAP